MDLTCEMRGKETDCDFSETNERMEIITKRNSWTAVNGRVGVEYRHIIRLLNRSSLRQLVSRSSFDGGIM